MRSGWIALTLIAGLSPVPAQQFTIATFAGGAPPATPVPAVGTSIGTPRRVALDGAGNLYFSGLNSVFKIDTTGVLTLIAGNSRPGFSGDGGPAIAASLNAPEGVAVDSGGNVYIADSSNNRIRMVSSAGIISTYAGTGVGGYSGDFGPANQAQLTLPSGLALDGAGNLYVADAGNSAVRVIAPGGYITTFAGTGHAGYVGDTTAATAAAVNVPTDVAVDSKGNVYIADTGNAVIREVGTDGNINTIAGNGTNAYLGDGGVATSAELYTPRGVAVDSGGNVYIAEFGDFRIRKVGTDGNINTIAGTGTAGYSGDGSSATSATLFGPWGIALDSGGNLYVADVFNLRVRKIASGGTISTVAGNGLLSYSGDGSAAAKAQLFAPRAVAADAQGNVYIADTANNRVRKVAAGGVITTVAGNGTAGFGGDNAAAAGAQLNQPVAVALDGSGNLYIADFNNNRVRMVNSSGTISTVAGSGTTGFGGDGNAAASASLNGPTALAVDKNGAIYVSDFNNNRVRMFTPGGSINTVAGNGISGFGGDGAAAVNASLNGPFGLAVDGALNLYIADLDNSRIRVVAPGGVINTVAGNGLAVVSGDGGPASQATLAAPQSLVLDGSGSLYVGDSFGRVRMISASGVISTVAGRGPTGYSGDGGDSTLAQINGPLGLAVDKAGHIYIADTGNNAIRQLQPVAVK
jgi:sugar lactone lactonase YvrE